jgi:cob(I)alamin adenosyltransferase
MGNMPQRFDEPRVALNRIYTRQGDKGETRLAGGQRVPKDSARIECYGTVDELNSVVGVACVSAAAEPRLAELAAILRRVQHELFNLGSMLATLPADLHAKQARITAADVTQLEREMDRANGELPPLRSCTSAERCAGGRSGCWCGWRARRRRRRRRCSI